MAEFEASRNILNLIPKIMHHIRTEMRQYAKGQLTVPQLRVLIRINRGNQTHKEVAEWIGVTPATLTRMVDTLVTRQLAKRTQDPKDRRQIHLQATSSGKALAEKYKDRVNVQIQTRIDALSSTEKSKLREGLRVLAMIFPDT